MFFFSLTMHFCLPGKISFSYPVIVKMAKSNADHQKAHRQRSERERLDIRIEGGAKRALERLAAYQGLSQHEVLTELLLSAERAAVGILSESEREHFYGFPVCTTLHG